MIERLETLAKELELTDKQIKFCLSYCKCNDRIQAYGEAGYKSKNRAQASMNASGLITKNPKIPQFMAAVKSSLDAEIGISRSMQMNALNEAYAVAKRQGQAASMVAAIREQNEMLGYHRELAPNAEKEAAIRQSMGEEQRALAAAAAALRAEQLALEPGAMPVLPGVVLEVADVAVKDNEQGAQNGV